MQKKQNEGWDDISKEDSSRKPITAWAVEIEGKINLADVYPTRANARYVRNYLLKHESFIKKASTRKVVLQVVPGR